MSLDQPTQPNQPQEKHGSSAIVIAIVAVIALAATMLFVVYGMTGGFATFSADQTSIQSGPTVVRPNALVSPSKPIAPPIDTIDPYRGPQSTPITIIYLADFTCEYCKDMASVWQQVRDEYAQDVRIVWKDLPLNSRSMAPHRAARCAQIQGGFWAYYDALWTRNVSSLQTTDFVNIAGSLGLNTADFQQCLASTDIEQVVLTIAEQGIGLGVDEVPSYFINGTYYQGLRDFDEIAELIEAALLEQ